MIDELHVVPRDDLTEHEDIVECVCGPECVPVKRDDGSFGWLYKHNSLDERDENGPWASIDALTTQIEERDRRIEELEEARSRVETFAAAGSDPAPLRVVRFALRPSEKASDE